MKAPFKNIEKKLKGDLSTVVLEVIRKITWAEKEIRKLEKDLPSLMRTRAKKVIRHLETLTKHSEKKLDQLLGKKLDPILSTLEAWLKSYSKTPKKKPRKKAASKVSRRKRKTTKKAKKTTRSPRKKS